MNDFEGLLARFTEQGFTLIPHTRAPTTDLFVRANGNGFVHCEWTREKANQHYFVIYNTEQGRSRKSTYCVDGSSCSVLVHESNITSHFDFENVDKLLTYLFENL
jgi:hypothetical protein